MYDIWVEHIQPDYDYYEFLTTTHVICINTHTVNSCVLYTDRINLMDFVEPGKFHQSLVTVCDCTIKIHICDACALNISHGIVKSGFITTKEKPLN